MKRKLLVVLAILAVLCWVGTASATLIGDFSFGTPGTGLAAEAVFVQNGTDLQITLTNTGGPALQNADILTVLFWNGSTSPTDPNKTTPVSATGNLTNGSTDPGVNWVYQAATLYGSNQAVSTTGLSGTFSNTNFFSSPAPPIDGINYGIAASLTDTQIPSPQFPLVVDNVVFHLTLPSTDLITVGNVTFQYGTSPGEPHHTVPIPPTALLLGSGLLGLVGLGWRRRKS